MDSEDMRPAPYVILAAIVLTGFIVTWGLSTLIDIAVYLDNRTLDGATGWSPEEWERYKVQAVEAHIIGTGWGIILTMALFVAWVDRWRFPKARTLESKGDG